MGIGILDWKRGSTAANPANSILARVGGRRAFLKLLAVAVGGAGAQQLASPDRAEATYTAGPPDTVDTDLTVQGNLVINQNVAIGTSEINGRLNVAGEVWVGGNQAIDDQGTVKRCYYAQ